MKVRCCNWGGGLVARQRSIYWEPLDASKLFGFEHDDDVFESGQKRIELLDSALNMSNGCKSFVDGEGENLTET
jgi:hypothetical protein